MPKVGGKHFAYTKAGEKEAKTHAAKTGQKVEHGGPYMKNSGFKMKGSPFQRNFGISSPMKEESRTGYTGAKIDPSRSYDYKEVAKIPSFRDMVSLEQQQDYAKKVDERRAKRKEDEQGARDAQAEYDRKVASGEITPSGPGEISQSEQQRKSLESRRQMEEEGRRLHPDPLEPTLQPLTLPETKTSYEGATKNEMTDVRREFKDDGSWDPKNNPEHAKIQNKINELYA